MKHININVFEKMHEAVTQGRGVTLTFAELELLHAVAGDAIAQAERELNKWVEVIEDYQCNVEGEQRREREESS